MKNKRRQYTSNMYVLCIVHTIYHIGVYNVHTLNTFKFLKINIALYALKQHWIVFFYLKFYSVFLYIKIRFSHNIDFFYFNIIPECESKAILKFLQKKLKSDLINEMVRKNILLMVLINSI